MSSWKSRKKASELARLLGPHEPHIGRGGRDHGPGAVPGFQNQRHPVFRRAVVAKRAVDLAPDEDVAIELDRFDHDDGRDLGSHFLRDPDGPRISSPRTAGGSRSRPQSRSPRPPTRTRPSLPTCCSRRRPTGSRPAPPAWQAALASPSCRAEHLYRVTPAEGRRIRRLRPARRVASRARRHRVLCAPGPTCRPDSFLAGSTGVPPQSSPSAGLEVSGEALAARAPWTRGGLMPQRSHDRTSDWSSPRVGHAVSC